MVKRVAVVVVAAEVVGVVAVAVGVGSVGVDRNVDPDRICSIWRWSVGNQRLILVMLSAYLLAASNSGCQLVHPQPPIDVEVRDAETKTPIEGAHVCVWHSSIHAVASSGN